MVVAVPLRGLFCQGFIARRIDRLYCSLCYLCLVTLNERVEVQDGSIAWFNALGIKRGNANLSGLRIVDGQVRFGRVALALDHRGSIKLHKYIQRIGSIFELLGAKPSEPYFDSPIDAPNKALRCRGNRLFVAVFETGLLLIFVFINLMWSSVYESSVYDAISILQVILVAVLATWAWLGYRNERIEVQEDSLVGYDLFGRKISQVKLSQVKPGSMTWIVGRGGIWYNVESQDGRLSWSTEFTNSKTLCFFMRSLCLQKNLSLPMTGEDWSLNIDSPDATWPRAKTGRMGS
jgi:hypothetical protein